MAVSGRLIVTLAYKAAGAGPKKDFLTLSTGERITVPQILYLGYDADEAKVALEAARDKGFLEIRICRNIDALWSFRFKADPVPVLRV